MNELLHKFKLGNDAELLLEKRGGGYEKVATVPIGSQALGVTQSAQGVETYAEMLTQCVGSAPKIFFLGASEINNGDPAQYFYDGDGGVWWAAMVKVN